jgi:hypothetical protein
MYVFVKTSHHGDIAFGKLSEAAADRFRSKATKLDTGRVVVGLGEKSGHQHVVESGACLVKEGVTKEDLARFVLTGEPINGDRQAVAIDVVGESAVRHLLHGETPTGEHRDITLDEGVWVVWRPREYDPEDDSRYVRD